MLGKRMHYTLLFLDITMVRRADFRPATVVDGAGLTSGSNPSERIFFVLSNMRALRRTVPSGRR
jgi:hypothetical protein